MTFDTRISVRYSTLSTRQCKTRRIASPREVNITLGQSANVNHNLDNVGNKVTTTTTVKLVAVATNSNKLLYNTCYKKE